jgi:hypothetical protein
MAMHMQGERFPHNFIQDLLVEHHEKRPDGHICDMHDTSQDDPRTCIATVTVKMVVRHIYAIPYGHFSETDKTDDLLRECQQERGIFQLFIGQETYIACILLLLWQL